MDYRMRKITFNSKYDFEIEYDGKLFSRLYGTVQDALREANNTMDTYGFKKADIMDATTAEVIVTVEEEP